MIVKHVLIGALCAARRVLESNWKSTAQWRLWSCSNSVKGWWLKPHRIVCSILRILLEDFLIHRCQIKLVDCSWNVKFQVSYVVAGVRFVKRVKADHVLVVGEASRSAIPERYKLVLQATFVSI